MSKTKYIKKVRRLREETVYWQALVKTIPDGVIFTDMEYAIQYINPAAERLLQTQNSKFKGKNIVDLLNSSKGVVVDETLVKLREERILRDLKFSFEIKKTGQKIFICLNAVLVAGKEGKDIGILWVMRDISIEYNLLQELQIANAELKEEKSRDYLVGLYNRRYYEACLIDEVERTLRKNGKLALLFVDIDNFKKGVNDKYDHAVGDEAIRTVAIEVMSITREFDIAARWGGEEYVVICPDTDEDGAVKLAEMIRKGIEERDIEIKHKGKIIKLKLTVSIGVANFIPNGTKDGLWKKANRAMHFAKVRGGNQIWHSTWPTDRGI